MVLYYQLLTFSSESATKRIGKSKMGTAIPTIKRQYFNKLPFFIAFLIFDVIGILFKLLKPTGHAIKEQFCK